MIKKIFIVACGIIIGILTGYFVLRTTSVVPITQNLLQFFQRNKVVGFLPYFQLSRAKADYSPYINTLTYFGLTINSDGKILKLTNPQETEPGWLALESGKANPFLASAKKKNLALSLLVFGGDTDTINSLMDNPISNADNLIADIGPIMKQHGFSDLNLDIEKSDEASGEARTHFTQFAQEIKNGLNREKLGTLTVEITADSLIKNQLISPADIASIADNIIVMAYDFHFIGSYVTGPVAPLAGAGEISEFDTKTAIGEALKIIPAEKLILGIPLYGYEWETINNFPRAAVIPATGLTASNARAEELLGNCATCSAKLDSDAQEHYFIYKDKTTGTFHQFFYPDAAATDAKINFAKENNLGGIALWALGYEGPTILNPLSNYK